MGGRHGLRRAHAGVQRARRRPPGLGSSYGIGEAHVRWAFERGCNYLYWGSLRRPSFGRALADLVRAHRDGIVLVVQSYARYGWLVGRSLHAALGRLGTDHADVLLLGMWNRPVASSIHGAALRLTRPMHEVRVGIDIVW